MSGEEIQQLSSLQLSIIQQLSILVIYFFVCPCSILNTDSPEIFISIMWYLEPVVSLTSAPRSKLICAKVEEKTLRLAKNLVLNGFVWAGGCILVSEPPWNGLLPRQRNLWLTRLFNCSEKVENISWEKLRIMPGASSQGAWGSREVGRGPGQDQAWSTPSPATVISALSVPLGTAASETPRQAQLEL